MLHWICKPFNDLSPKELYEVMKLRSEVFVVEQNCVYQDADSKDEYCYHLMGFHENELAAYARLLPANIAYTYISIGRVVTSPAHRGLGGGKELLTQAIHQCYELFGKQAIKIGAQLYLKKLYESFGFKQSGDEYDEDGIPHIPMILDNRSS